MSQYAKSETPCPPRKSNSGCVAVIPGPNLTYQSTVSSEPPNRAGRDLTWGRLSSTGRTANWRGIWNCDLKRPGAPLTARKRRARTIDEEACAAVPTRHARISFQSPGRGLAADAAHGVRRIGGFGHVVAAVDDLAVVAIAGELGDRIAGNFDFDCAAAAGDPHRFDLDVRLTFRHRFPRPFGRKRCRSPAHLQRTVVSRRSIPRLAGFWIVNAPGPRFRRARGSSISRRTIATFISSCRDI